MKNCPICESSSNTLLNKLDTKTIIKDYSDMFSINVSFVLSKYDYIYCYECATCDYSYFYPRDITGNDTFYEQLEKFPWYYMKYKWEHNIAEKYIKNGDKILEIGCAKGDFIKKVSEKKNIIAEGLELNNSAISIARKQGIKVYSNTIEEFSKNNLEKYDVVCSFQVLEHVADPKSMIKASIDTLKVGGLLIIGIPNNDSFISRDLVPTLNIPPHHMGLFHEKTFKKIQHIYKIKLEKIEIEPLQNYHFGYFVYIHIGQHIKKLRFVGKVINKLAFFLAYPLLILCSKSIKGHTMVAIYKKIES